MSFKIIDWLKETLYFDILLCDVNSEEEDIIAKNPHK